MANDGSIRITTIPKAVLLRRLGLGSDESIDDAIAGMGYVRLDLGDPPRHMIPVIPSRNAALGGDPGHRAAASRTMRSLLYVAHAEGDPIPERIAACIGATHALCKTDVIGGEIVDALAAYHVVDPPAETHLPDIALECRTAPSIVYGVARDRGVITDVAFERAVQVGGGDAEWREALMAQIGVSEPVRFARRHDGADYESLGGGSQLSEMLAWLRSHPDADVEQYRRHAMLVGVNPEETALGIQRLLTGQ